MTLAVADGTAMEAFVAHPSGGGGPGLLVLQEAFGVNAHIRSVAERYAKLGFTAIAPELFHRTAPPGFEGSYTDYASIREHVEALTREGILADVGAAYDWLARQAKIPADRIAAVGYCMGGRCAFIANATLPLAAAVSYYGTPDSLEDAAKQHGPILMFWGGLDQHIPPERYRPVADALTAAGADHEQVVFAKADHGFNCDARASYNPGAARQALALALEFLRVHGVLQ
ncbi:MAG TPA: dienelactone hydrolase family protein [Candidatus Tyrphobacter sp.]